MTAATSPSEFDFLFVQFKIQQEQVRFMQKQIADLQAVTEQQEEEISYLNGQLMGLQ